jgi:thiamine kinase-like enzyme
MKIEFQKDFFSNSTPKWSHCDSRVNNIFEFINIFLPEVDLSIKGSIECSGTFGINSSNFRIQLKDKVLLLKRWSKNVNFEQVNSILELMTWLSEQSVPLPKPTYFNNGNKIVCFDNYLWSVFPFISGDYFSGKNNEIEIIAEFTGKLNTILINAPLGLNVESGTKHLTIQDNEIIDLIEKDNDKWDYIFGEINSSLLKQHWSFLRSTWDKLYKANINPGLSMLTHFDLHPHNILIRDSKVTSILDFESCRKMPICYSLAYSGLKLCRQAVVNNGDTKIASSIGQKYVEILSANFSYIDPYISNFVDYANIETIRRLCVIFRTNIEEKSAKWNHVLPILLANLYESKLIFSKVK